MLSIHKNIRLLLLLLLCALCPAACQEKADPKETMAPNALPESLDRADYPYLFRTYGEARIREAETMMRLIAKALTAAGLCSYLQYIDISGEKSGPDEFVFYADCADEGRIHVAESKLLALCVLAPPACREAGRRGKVGRDALPAAMTQESHSQLFEIHGEDRIKEAEKLLHRVANAMVASGLCSHLERINVSARKSRPGNFVLFADCRGKDRIYVSESQLHADVERSAFFEG